eukprot:CAMPEP_0197858256 /NCGR_PEP_ID=MMETSP1438-20131217/31934_2 /TAXON_ID=1461541 /ORGANISM="Pterosperma sp., Strain CCMP1384" /LENGTH=105 /DNA_ID=CAMNT_0043474361 /DNA_START=101 /DNA_END=416 /DNA_ORIENTATION=-
MTGSAVAIIVVATGQPLADVGARDASERAALEVWSSLAEVGQPEWPNRVVEASLEDTVVGYHIALEAWRPEALAYQDAPAWLADNMDHLKGGSLLRAGHMVVLQW